VSMRDRADVLADADAADAHEPTGPLHGLPVAVKDLEDVAGLPTRSGSLVTSTQPAAADGFIAAPCCRRDHHWQDQHTGVRHGLVHVQRSVRRDPESMGSVEVGRRQQRWCSGSPGQPDAAHRRRQRPRRLAVQPRGLLQRGRPPPTWFGWACAVPWGAPWLTQRRFSARSPGLG
jgi:hypothetical protein